MRVLFVGSCVAFSKRMLRFVEKEFAGLAVARCEDIDAVTEVGAASAEPPRLVVVDEAFVDDLLARREVYRAAAGSADLVLAYRQSAHARRVFDAEGEEAGAETVKLLPMNLQIEVWLSVLCLLIHGETYLPAELLERVQLRAPALAPSPAVAPAAPSPRPSGGAGGLTRRELDVVALVADGKSNKVIARQLELSEHTVKLHLHHIIAKLGVQNRTGAARWFLARTASEPTALVLS
jgi:DNA-binding NarL/FixJ family response regulator